MLYTCSTVSTSVDSRFSIVSVIAAEAMESSITAVKIVLTLFSITPSPPRACILAARSISFCASTESAPTSSTLSKKFAETSSSLIMLATIPTSVAIGPPKFVIRFTTFEISPEFKRVFNVAGSIPDKSSVLIRTS